MQSWIYTMYLYYFDSVVFGIYLFFQHTFLVCTQWGCHFDIKSSLYKYCLCCLRNNFVMQFDTTYIYYTSVSTITYVSMMFHVCTCVCYVRMIVYVHLYMFDKMGNSFSLCKYIGSNYQCTLSSRHFSFFCFYLYLLNNFLNCVLFLYFYFP